MRVRSIVAGIFLAMPAAIPVLCQEPAPGIELLSLPIPRQASAPARAPLLIAYSGAITPGTVVRVFRNSKQYLSVDLPKQTKDGECVLYTSTETFPLESDGQMLHVDMILTLFDLAWRAGHQINQMYTLVFEYGGHNPSDGQLKLSKADVKEYFAHAVQVPLYATSDMIADRERQKQASAPDTGVVATFLQGITSWVRPKTVAAAAKPVTIPFTLPPLPAPSGGRKCQEVHSYNASNTIDGSTNDKVTEVLSVDSLTFAIRSPSACSD